jgi:hypothetical protein
MTDTAYELHSDTKGTELCTLRIVVAILLFITFGFIELLAWPRLLFNLDLSKNTRFILICVYLGCLAASIFIITPVRQRVHKNSRRFLLFQICSRFIGILIAINGVYAVDRAAADDPSTDSTWAAFPSMIFATLAGFSPEIIWFCCCV